MKTNSIWSDFKQKNICDSLNKNIDVDVAIIGAGLTGISTAYHLINKDLKVAVFERNEAGCGVTSRTTGKLTYLQENIYSKLKKYHGYSNSKLYLESQIDAIKTVKRIIKDNNIDCNLEKVSSYVFSNSNSNFNEEIRLLKDFNISVKDAFILPNKSHIKSGYYVKDTYVFHPLKYLYALKDICLNNGISIYENTNILEVKKSDKYFLCCSNGYKIKAKYVVIASHYPYFLIPFFMPFKSYIEKSYIEAFKSDINYKFSAISTDDETVSMRYYSNNDTCYEIFLSNSHNTSILDNYKENFNDMLSKKNNRPDYLWSNNDIMTIDSLPFIGSLNRENTFLIGTGYNTWGMTNASIAGVILSDIILKKENKYISLFSPYRGINLLKAINFPMILGSNAYSFIKSKLIKQKYWYSSSLKFEKRNGKNIAIYIDKNKKEHIVYNLCPHLKCSLIFNEKEKTWDCPCHGSRFDIDGKCIEGPSNYDITYKE